jgi:hypothetical protein
MQKPPTAYVIKENDTVKLLNVYHGVPVVNDATVIEIREGVVRMKTHPSQLVCMRISRSTYVSFNGLTYSAIVASVDPLTETALLTNIKGCHGLGKRKFVRVEPAAPTDVDVFVIKTVNTDNGKWFTTSILDISIFGMGLIMDSILIALIKLNVRDNIKLNFYLPGSGSEEERQIYIDGVVCNLIITDDPANTRVGIRTFPDKDAETALTRYVSLRQNDILKSLKQDRENTGL